MSEGGGETGGMADGGRRGGARWVTPIVLGLCCLVGAAVGFLRTQPVYRSEAVVWQAPPGTAPLPWAYPMVVPTAPVSREVVARAMRGPRWEQSWPTGRAAETSFLTRLSARGVPEGIRVIYEDSDRRLARERLGAFVDAHVRAVREKMDAWRADQLKPLEERRAAVETEVAQVERRAREEAAAVKAVEERIAAFTAVVRVFQDLHGSVGPGPEGAARRVVEAISWPLRDIVYGPDRPQVNPRVMRFRLELAERERDRLLKELDGLRSRCGEIDRAAAAAAATVVSPPSVAVTVIDDRWRDAAWGAVFPLGVFAVIRVPRWLWAAIERRRTRVRGAFEVVVRPRAVVPVEE